MEPLPARYDGQPQVAHRLGVRLHAAETAVNRDFQQASLQEMKLQCFPRTQNILIPFQQLSGAAVRLEAVPRHPPDRRGRHEEGQQAAPGLKATSNYHLKISIHLI